MRKILNKGFLTRTRICYIYFLHTTFLNGTCGTYFLCSDSQNTKPRSKFNVFLCMKIVLGSTRIYTENPEHLDTRKICTTSPRRREKLKK